MLPLISCEATSSALPVGLSRSAINRTLVLGYLRLYDAFKVERAKLAAQRTPTERSTASAELLASQLTRPLVLGANGDTVFSTLRT